MTQCHDSLAAFERFKCAGKREHDEPMTESPSARKNFLEVQWNSFDAGKRFVVLAAVQREDDAYVSFALQLPGAVSEGATVEQAINNLKEAVAGCVLSYKTAGDPIPWQEPDRRNHGYDFMGWIEVDV